MKSLYPNKHNLFIWVQALVMLAGLIFWNWDPLFVVMAYFFETIIIGIIHIFKMGVVWRMGMAQTIEEKTNLTSSIAPLGLILFFFVHYYMFVSIQSIFVFSMFSKKVPAFGSGFGLIKNYGWLFQQKEFILLFSIQAVTQITYLIRNWLIPERYQGQTIQGMFIQPYIRIFIQQFTAILAGFFFILMNTGFVAAVLVVLFRLIVDSFLVELRRNELAKEKLVKLVMKNKEANPLETRKQIDGMLDH